MPAKRQRGFTLVEVIITVVVMGLLAVAGTSIVSSTFTTARVVDSGQAVQNDARYAVERLARELREVKFVDKATGYAISSALTAGSSGITFNKVDASGTDVTVTVTRSGGLVNLAYSAPAGSAALATQVTAFSLDYLKLDPATGATSATTSPVDVRFIVISLTVADATSGQSVTERVRVALRNT